MTSDMVLGLYSWLKENGIDIWIDGGWGVDALLGRPTREHSDLDIAVHRNNNPKLRRLLENEGYKEEERDDSSEFMYVMQNGSDGYIDIHVFQYGENGATIYGIEYPFGSLTGTGTIGGQEVNCIEPGFMLRFKTGYPPKEKDLKDVRALCEKFGFELPSSYTTCKPYSTGNASSCICFAFEDKRDYPF